MADEFMNNLENDVINAENEEKISTEEVSIYKGMNEVIDHTRKIIAGMQLGEKLTVKDLVDKVHAEVEDMPVGNVTNIVQMFLKKCKDVTVEIGRGGGVFKGGKPKRVDNRPRCPSCHQVIRPDMHKQASKSEQVAE